jgi:hypothetical protein
MTWIADVKYIINLSQFYLKLNWLVHIIDGIVENSLKLEKKESQIKEAKVEVHLNM